MTVGNVYIQSTFSVEATFSETGFTLSWTNFVPVTPTERKLLSDYFRNPFDAAVKFGTCSIHPKDVSLSVHALYCIAGQVLHICAHAKCDDADSIRSMFVPIPPEIAHTAVDHGISVDVITATVIGMVDHLISESVNEGQSVQATIKQLYSRTSAETSVCFSIVENSNPRKKSGGSGTESIDDFVDPILLMVTCNYSGKEMPLKTAMKLLADDGIDSITENLRLAAKESRLAKKIYNDGKIRDELRLSVKGFFVFINESDIFTKYGITCRIPNRWKARRARLSISTTIGNSESFLGAESLLSFDTKLCINSEPLTPSEIQALLDSQGDMFLYKGQWLQVSRSELEKTFGAYQKVMAAYRDGIRIGDAIRCYLYGKLPTIEGLTPDALDIDVSGGSWFNALFMHSEQAITDEPSDPGSDFTAELRPYQKTGVRWLNFMRCRGLGACLSDDMGLGKTVQAIAILEMIRRSKKRPSLVIIPASLLINWQRELERFAPKIRYSVLHASFSDRAEFCIPDDTDVDVYITTYSMTARLENLQDVEWECVIIDEAQAIKNPKTKQARAVKQLKAKFRLAMTGTPIENSPLDLWSIFNFINPGLVHSPSEFVDSFYDEAINGAAPNPKIMEVLRLFILRRTKTDKKIIEDLPEKIEMKNYCGITRRQSELYLSVTSALSNELRSVSGIKRRGAVLAGILRLKQICNHPDNYLGTGAYLISESGKFQRLVELCELIHSANERVLVFTQFKEMCEPLSRVLNGVFKKRGMIINGSTPVSERGAIVEAFNRQSEEIPYIVLSLRAGGVGLNLTAANHVIHFDRWWNPAVEDQATDRSFRIGQTKNVIVHKLICTGTLEEKIDTIIERKKQLAKDIIEQPTVDITTLSDSEIIELISLS